MLLIIEAIAPKEIGKLLSIASITVSTVLKLAIQQQLQILIQMTELFQVVSKPSKLEPLAQVEAQLIGIQKRLHQQVLSMVAATKIVVLLTIR
jgi:polysaccharide pyruvyl transferase WcaK-like protein